MRNAFIAESHAMKNMSLKLEETVPNYFNGIVLQRHNLEMPESSFGHLKFQVAFNLAVVWMIVFVSLSKGMLVRCPIYEVHMTCLNWTA
jgi:solute carrier family 6 (neurotransmitter transporter)